MRKQGGKTFVQAVQRRAAKEDIKKQLRAGLDSLALELCDVGRQLSSGTVDSANAGHPYSAIRPNRAFDPALINVGFARHPGKRFADAWEPLPKSQGPGIRNVSPVGKFLEFGTSRMVARPIDRLIRLQADKILGKHLDNAFKTDGTVHLSGADFAPTLLRPAAS